MVDLKNLLHPSSEKKNTMTMQAAKSSEIIVPVSSYTASHPMKHQC
jgi:hypothetical protein